MTTLGGLGPKLESSEITLPARGITDRPFPKLCDETKRDRAVGLAVIAVIVAMYAVMTLGFWAPADGGVDQNAYLLGGRLIAEHFTPKYTLPNAYSYVGNMFIRTSKLEVQGGDYYPKYPFGLPLLYAMFFWITGPTRAIWLAFLFSPVCSILAVTGMFFLARLIAGSFAGVMAAILLGTSQLMIELSNNPNSHASCTAFIVWGMYVLVKWWQTGRICQGIVAGFLLGYAGLIRYSEGLLVLPIAVACASRLRWGDWRSYLRCSAPGLSWAVPISALLIFNKCTMGNWTGYDSTNESEGFTWLKFTQTWEQMIRTYDDMGAFFALPIGLAGIAILFRRSARLGLMLLAWLLPGTALYTAYYWSPDRGVSYARFILTFVPVVMLGAAIFFKDGILDGRANARWHQRLPRELAVGMVVMAASSVGAYRAVHGLHQGQTGGGMQPLAEQYRLRQSLANTGQELLAHVPVNAVLFVDDNGGGAGQEKPLNYVQFLRNWNVYATDAFESGGPRRTNRRFNAGQNNLANADPNAAVPTTRQKLQIDYTESLYEGKSTSQLRLAMKSVIDGALDAGHEVFALVADSHERAMRIAFALAGKYTVRSLDSWSDLPAGPPDEVPLEADNTKGRRRGGGGGGRRLPGFGGGAAAVQPVVTKWVLLQIRPESGPKNAPNR